MLCLKQLAQCIFFSTSGLSLRGQITYTPLSLDTYNTGEEELSTVWTRELKNNMVWHPLHAEIPYNLGQIILDFLSLLSYLLGEVVWGRLKKDAFLKQRFGFLDFTQFSGKKKSLPPKQNHYLLSCSLHRAGYLQLLKLLAMAVRCVNQANAVPDEKHDALPLSIQLSVLEDCYVTMLDIAMLDVTGTPLTTERVTAMVLQAVSFDQWKRCDPLGILFYNVERKLCIAVVTAIVMTLRSLIKTEPRTAKLRQVDSHYEYQGLTGKWTSEWMNQSLVFCSLPLCHCLILSFQVVCFWEKILQHDFACCLSMLPLKFQGTWMVPSSYPFPPKQTSEKNSDRIPMFCTSCWNLLEYLCQSTQRRISCNTIFCKAYVPFGAPFGAQQWKFPSCLSIFVAFLE